MNGSRPAALVMVLTLTIPAVAVQPPQPRPANDRAQSTSSVERWVQQLENDLDHLQEDLHFERGRYPAGLQDQAEQALRSVTHFHHTLGRTRDRQHLLKDFREMDQDVHQLVRQLEQSDDRWLRRQAARISYADEQLHYVLQPRERDGDADDAARELLARHAHVLETESRNLQSLVDRFARHEANLRNAVAEFVEQVEHFHQVVERGADAEHLADDFDEVDGAWHRAVQHINRSSSRLYILRRAQDVNRVHNQIHEMLAGDHHHGQAVETQQPRPPVEERPVPRRQNRPTIQFEIPGVGRFEFPR